MENIAGTKIPVRASSESKLADAAESVSRSRPVQEFDVQQTQPAARRPIGTVATDVKNAATSTMGNEANATATDTQAFKDAVAEIAPGKPFTDLSAPQQSKVLPRAPELKTARNGLSIASKATDFGDTPDQSFAPKRVLTAPGRSEDLLRLEEWGILDRRGSICILRSTNKATERFVRQMIFVESKRDPIFASRI